MEDILTRLAAPFPPEAISWRVGSTTADKTKGMALAFLDARDVQDRLNEVCGPNWQCEHIVSNSGSKVTCRIGIKFGDEWIWRSNGAGDTDYEAEKGSYSDSLKRAAVLWNVGRYLYDLQSPWVAIEQKGKSFVIKKDELPKLKALLPKATPFGDKPANTGIQQKSAHQARKDGDYTDLLEEMKMQPTPEILKDWAKLRKDRIWAMPDSWQQHFREAYEAQMDALRAKVAA